MAKKATKKAKKPAAKKAARKAAPKARKSAARAAKAPAAPKWKMQGVQDVIPNLVLKNAAGAIEFYKTAFGAQELMRHPSPDGKGIWHAELRIGDTVIAMNDEMPGQGPALTTAASAIHKATGSFMIYSPDVDAMFNRAVAAGAKPAMPVMDMFWGDRMGTVTDPFGQVWMLGTHVKDLSMEEMRKAGEEFAKQMAQQPPAGAPASKPPAPGGSQPPPPTAMA
jgi:uncharacterized glyoxalase superfamily protein PhnB